MQIHIYNVIFFIDENENILVLKRAPWKKFGANKYTGIGGNVLPEEHKNIEKSLIRELTEETKINPEIIDNLQFEGTKLTVNTDDGDHLIYYFSTKVSSKDIQNLNCNEGTLEWIKKEDIEKIDFVPGVKEMLLYILDKKISRFTLILDNIDGTTTVKLDRVE
jgi:8-oxo-dGTP pyrophosphatase MutT (NUDIX family)